MQIKFALSLVPVLCVLAAASYHPGSNRTQRLMRSVIEPEDDGQNLLESEKISHHRLPKRLTEDEQKKSVPSTQTLQLVNNKTHNESFKSEKQHSSLEATIINAKNPAIQLTTFDNRKFESDFDGSLNCTPISLPVSTTKPVSNKKKVENSKLGSPRSNCRPGRLPASSNVKPALTYYDPSMHPTTVKNSNLSCHSPGSMDCTSSSLPSCRNEQQVTKNVNHNYNIIVTCDKDRNYCSFKNLEPKTFFKKKVGRPFIYPGYKTIRSTSDGVIPSKEIPFSVTISSDDVNQKSEKTPPSSSDNDPANEVFYAEICYTGNILSGTQQKSYLSPNHGTIRPKGTHFIGRNHDHVYSDRKYFASDSEKYKQMAQSRYTPGWFASRLVTDLPTIENISFDELSNHPGYKKVPSALAEGAYRPKSYLEMPAQNPYHSIKNSGRTPLRKIVKKAQDSYRNTRFVST